MNDPQVTEYLQRLEALIAHLEKLGEIRQQWFLQKSKDGQILQKAEDKARSEALESSMAISKMTHYIKDKTKQERLAAYNSTESFRHYHQEYEHTVELINAIKFHLRFVETLANTSKF